MSVNNARQQNQRAMQKDTIDTAGDLSGGQFPRRLFDEFFQQVQEEARLLDRIRTESLGFNQQAIPQIGVGERLMQQVNEGDSVADNFETASTGQVDLDVKKTVIPYELTQESVEDTVDDVLAFIDEHGLPNPDAQREGAARANQLKDHAANDEPLEPTFWEEISNFHARHRAQGNDECDESDLPDKADDTDFDACYFDPGWFSDKTWGGDAGKEQADQIVEAIEGTEGVELSGGDTGNSDGGVTDRDLEHAPDWDRPLMEMYQGVTTAEDTGVTLVDFAASGTPDFVLERIRDAIRDGAMFSDIEAISGDEIMEFRQVMADAVGTDDFTLDSITESVMDFADIPRDEAERIARTESSAALNRAREIGYEERGEGDELFYWTGAEPGDDRQTDACEWLINKTNPFYDGTPVPMHELKDLIEEAPEHDDDMPDDMARPDSFVVHINERSTFSKAPPGWRDL